MLDAIRAPDLSPFRPGPMLASTMAHDGSDVVKIGPKGEGGPMCSAGYCANRLSIRLPTFIAPSGRLSSTVKPLKVGRSFGARRRAASDFGRNLPDQAVT